MESLLNEIQAFRKDPRQPGLLETVAASRRRTTVRESGSAVRYRPEAVEQWVDALPTGGNGRKPRSVQARATDLPERLSHYRSSVEAKQFAFGTAGIVD